MRVPDWWSGAGAPEFGYGVAGREVVGGELPEVFGTGFGPEFLAAFDAAVDLFEGRFHVGGGDGQALIPVGRVVHSGLLVLQVGQCFADQSAGSGVAVGSGGEAEFLWPGGEFGDDFRDLAWTGPGDPAVKDLPAFVIISNGHGGWIDVI